MGRLPKGFKKNAHKNDEEEDHAESTPVDHQSTSHAAKQSGQAAAKAHPPAEQKQAAAHASDDDEEGAASGPESRGQMVQRHKREMMAFKKNLQRMGKKSKDELAKMTQEIEDRHAKELRELDAQQQQQQQQVQQPAEESVQQQHAEGVNQALGGLALEGEGHGQKTKAMKRREKHAKEAADREARIASEQAELGPSERATEEVELASLLLPKQLRIREIRADGHCMYRAVEDQLTQHGGPSLTYQQLRSQAAGYIRAHPDDFAPFIYDEDQAGDMSEQVERYCSELESTAVWGGQLELGALAQVLKRQIKVYAVGMPLVTLGDEFAPAAPDAPSAQAPLQLCYLRHAFGLGEHYNSCEAMVTADA